MRERSRNAANRRLRRMTDGRYELTVREEAKDRRSHFGLDIDVLDNYTGRRRPSQTLSGGESFLASLSLALDGSGNPVFTTESENARLRFLRDVYGLKSVDELDDEEGEYPSDATAQDIALVVVKATVDGVGVEPVARFDNALDYEAQGGERVCACGAQTYSLAVTSAKAQPRYVESNRVVTLPPFHRC